MPATVFLVPQAALGQTADVTPERITSHLDEWIEHSRELLDKKRRAAREGKWAPTHPVGDTAAHLRPSGAESCPALAELDSIGLILKWPATAILRQVGPKAWQVKPSTNYDFIHYSPLTSFAEAGEAEARGACLAGAEHVAFAAQAQILLGDAETVLGLAQRLEPRPRRFAERAPIDEQARRAARAAPDPAA